MLSQFKLSHYLDMARHSQYADGLRIWDHPTFRVLYGGREIGRTNALFCAGKLRRWMQEVGGLCVGNRAAAQGVPIPG